MKSAPDWILRYLDDALSEEQVNQLAGELAKDPARRREFAVLLLQRVQLSELRQEAMLSASDATNIIPLKRREFGTGPRDPRHLSRNLWLALAAAVVLGLFLARSFFPPTNNQPLLASASAGAILERSGEIVAPREGMLLQSGDVLTTLSNSTATINYGQEKTLIALAAGAEMQILPWTKGKHFQIRQGAMEATVARQQPFKPLRVTTTHAQAIVLGTRFIITTATNFTRLDVSQGEVRLTRSSDGASVDVPEDFYAISAATVDLGALPKTGRISREYWTNLPGKSVNFLLEHPRFLSQPDARDFAGAFELAPVTTNSVGCRIRGYLHPPITGDYEFWLAAQTQGALFLSPSEDVQGKVQIAYSETRDPRDWEQKRFSGGSQWSSPIPLVAGRRYYIEAVLQIDNGLGHLSVAWKRPGANRELISGEYLSAAKTTK